MNNTSSGLVFAGNTGAVIELRAANTFNALVRLQSGTLGIIGDNNFGPASNRLVLGNGTSFNPTLRLDAAGITLARPITVSGHSTVNTNGFDGAFSGQMIGGQSTYNLTKTGAGILTLTANGYGATTQVSAVRFDERNPVEFSRPVLSTCNNGGTLEAVHDRRLVTVNNGALAPGAGGNADRKCSAFARRQCRVRWGGRCAQDQISH